MRAPITLLVAAAALAVPATAAAADGTLSKDTPTYAWDGGPGSGHYEPETGLGTYMFGCGAPVPDFYDCEGTLLEIKDKGDLKVAIDAAGDDTDLDLYLYESDAEGEYDPSEDEPIAMHADEKNDESVTVKGIAPGFYVAHVEFFSGMDETYKGTAEMSGFPVPVTTVPVVQTPPPVQTQTAPPPPPPAQPAPAAKKPSKRAACMKKAKKIKKAKARKRAVKKCKRLKR